ncbi:MAG: glycosyltransferase family 39 protein [Deltaproteobacteria bacterium]|nr:glycosyltransferase family 39 protein [Deltaproteobacteria bacterium]
MFSASRGRKARFGWKNPGGIPIYAGVCIAALLFFSLGLGAASRSKGAERYFLLSGFTMAETGDWLTPVYEEKPRFQKPPLAYWLIAASYKLFGVHLWSARLPSAVAGALGVMLTGLLGEWLFRSRRAGLLAALFLATCTGYLIQSRMAVTDIYLLLFLLVAISLYSMELFSTKGSELRRVGMWASMAMAFLSKGHLGIIIPFMIAAAIGPQRGFSLRKALRPWASPLGWLIFLLIAAPWFVAMRWAHGSLFFEHLLFSETKRRVGLSLLNIWSNAALYSKKWFLYFFPASWFLMVVLLDRKANSGGREEREQRITRFLWTWIASVFFLFVFLVYDFQSSYYLVPLTPAMALLVASHAAVRNGGTDRSGKLWHGFFNAMLVLIGTMFMAAAIAIMVMGWWSVRAFLVNAALMAVTATGGLKLHRYLKYSESEIWKPLSVVTATIGAFLIIVIGLWEPIIKEPAIARMLESASQRPGPDDLVYAVGISKRDRSWLVVFGRHRIDRIFYGPSALKEANLVLQEEKTRGNNRVFLAVYSENLPELNRAIRQRFVKVGKNCQMDWEKIRRRLRLKDILAGKLHPGNTEIQECAELLVSISGSP